MAKERTHEQLLEVIREQEAELRQLKHRAERAEALVRGSESRARTLRALSLSLFAGSDSDRMHSLVTEAVVDQLRWDMAATVALQADHPIVLSSHCATRRQLEHLHDYLGQDAWFREAYGKREALTTIGGKDAQALRLRSLFQTDEAVAMPILFGEELYGYLIACGHTREGRQRSQEDVDFLATVATLLGHALQNG